MKKRMLSILLTVCMLLTLLPVSALAVGSSTPITGQTMSVTFGLNGQTLYYVDQADGWNAAVGSGNTTGATVTLLADWTAGVDGSLGSGDGFGISDTTGNNEGCIRVPGGKTVTLDLNGHTINRGLTQPTDYGSVIRIAGGSLTLQDSSSTDVTKQGKITGAWSYDGGAIDIVNSSGSLVMTGGSITGNKANGDKNNGRSGAGGVYVTGDCVGFTMTGGSITDNTVYNTASVGGVLVVGGGASKFTVGGTAQITGNKNATGGEHPSNVYLPKGKAITCSTQTSLTTGASIGVTTEIAPTEGKPVKITERNAADYSDYFYYDGAGVVSSVDTDEGVKFMTGVIAVKLGTATGNPTTYNTFEEGWNAAVASTSDTTVTLLADWTAGVDGSLGSGAGFGTNSTTGHTTGGILVPQGKTITLDLNGHTINRGLVTAEYGSVIRIEDGNLTLQDSSTSKTGNITGGLDSTAGGVYVGGGSFTMLDGNITGNKGFKRVDYDYAGSGVFVETGATFTMTGGSITNNTDGAGVYLIGYHSDSIGGTARIIGNKSGGKDCNFYLANDKQIACSPLTTGASIGVTTKTAPTEGNPIPITKQNSTDFSKYFHSDNNAYETYDDSNTVMLKLKPKSATPTATTTTVAKTSAAQASVSFALTNTPHTPISRRGRSTRMRRESPSPTE